MGGKQLDMYNMYDTYDIMHVYYVLIIIYTQILYLKFYFATKMKNNFCLKVLIF